MNWMQSFLNVPPLLWLLFLAPLLFFIAGIVFMLRVYVRIYKKVQRNPDEAVKSVPLTSGKQALWLQRIGAYIGKEKDEILLVLELRAKLTAKGYRVKFLSPAAFNYRLYYPLGAPGRQSLRKAKGETYLLRKGDAVYFDSSFPHGWSNKSKKTAVVLWICSPSTF